MKTLFYDKSMIYLDFSMEKAFAHKMAIWLCEKMFAWENEDISHSILLLESLQNLLLLSRSWRLECSVFVH
jgi:hypothetical protein